MLSSISSSCFAAALLFVCALANPPAISIAFGNIAYTGITFGKTFSINWYGGDGTPATIRLLTGNAASMQTAATLASKLVGPVDTFSADKFCPAGLTASPYLWTPVASQSVRPGQSYALSIEQSRLTNYSPMFTIGTHPAEYDQLRLPLRQPVRIGTGHYYPLKDRAVQHNGKAPNSDFGIFPRSEGVFPRSEGVFPRSEGVFPRSEGVFPRSEGSFLQDEATATPTGTVASLAYATGTPIGSHSSLVYATGTSTGSISSLPGAARASSSPIEYVNAGQTLSLGRMVAKFVTLGNLLVLLWV
ncbi:MAG: hypothetical protein Q9184_004034 [Pyrenodesmia sp. 2 TL-2023]